MLLVLMLEQGEEACPTLVVVFGVVHAVLVVSVLGVVHTALVGCVRGLVYLGSGCCSLLWRLGCLVPTMLLLIDACRCASVALCCWSLLPSGVVFLACHLPNCFCFFVGLLGGSGGWSLSELCVSVVLCLG